MSIDEKELYFIYTTPKCSFCDKSDQLFLQVSQVEAFTNGTAVQKAFPTLTPAKREQILTGTCARCWDVYIKE